MRTSSAAKNRSLPEAASDGAVGERHDEPDDTQAEVEDRQDVGSQPVHDKRGDADLAHAPARLDGGEGSRHERDESSLPRADRGDPCQAAHV